MKKIIFTYGIIGGLITGIWGTFAAHLLPDSVTINMRMWFGYASMIVAFAMIFPAIKNYKERFGAGYITFGKALQIGLLITLVASTLYVAVWLLGYYCLFPDYFDKFIAQMQREMQASGKSAAEITKQVAGLEQFKEMYKNPVFNILMTYVEILPVGIVISLIAALIARNPTKPTSSSN